MCLPKSCSSKHYIREPQKHSHLRLSASGFVCWVTSHKLIVVFNNYVPRFSWKCRIKKLLNSLVSNSIIKCYSTMYLITFKIHLRQEIRKFAREKLLEKIQKLLASSIRKERSKIKIHQIFDHSFKYTVRIRSFNCR